MYLFWTTSKRKNAKKEIWCMSAIQLWMQQHGTHIWHEFFDGDTHQRSHQAIFLHTPSPDWKHNINPWGLSSLSSNLDVGISFHVTQVALMHDSAYANVDMICRTPTQVGHLTSFWGCAGYAIASTCESPDAVLLNLQPLTPQWSVHVPELDAGWIHQI